MPNQCASMNVLRAERAAKKLGVGRSTFYEWQDPNSPYYKSSLPRPIELGERAVGWLESELDEWLAARASARLPAGGARK